MSAFLMRLHDFVHVGVQARGNAFDEQTLAQLVEFGKRFATQITRGPDDEVLEFQAAESIPQRALEHAEDFADPGLPAPDPIADVSRRREAVDS